MTGASWSALLRKEAHHLWPLISALLAVEAMSLIYLLSSQSPDQLSWFGLSILYNGTVRQWTSVFFAIGAVGGYLMFSHEREHRTLAFLWALPVRRYQVVGIKMLVVFLMLAAYALLTTLSSWLLHTMGTSSWLAQEFSWHLWAIETVMLIGLFGLGIPYGAVAAWFRMPGVLTLMVIWVGAIAFASLNPAYHFMDVGALMEPEFRGKDMTLPATAWLFHGSLAAFSFVLAIYLWTRRAEQNADQGAPSPWTTRLVNLAIYGGAIMFAIGYAASRILPTNMLAIGTTTSMPTLNTIDTDDFQFSFYLVDEPWVALLVGDAPAMYRGVRHYLGEPLAEQVVVNVTDDATEHLGVAGWKRLRMNRSAVRGAENRPHVFIHELTHVLADQVADRRLTAHTSDTIFFNEGYAEWVSFALLDMPRARAALNLLAAAAWQRLDLKFQDLIALGSQYDEGLVYALGLSWVDSLVTVCGPAAPRDALRAMASPDVPQRIYGGLFWQDVLSRNQCSLGRVNDDMNGKMWRDPVGIDQVPEVTGGATLLPDRIDFQVSFAGGLPDTAYTLIVRVRDNPSVGSNGTLVQRTTIVAGEPATITFGRHFMYGGKFQYQLGVEFIPDERPYFGRWIDQG